MDYTEFNYASLMAVISATVFDDTGAYIPGELMPSGNPVRALGATPAFLRDKELVTQWHAAVKDAYEREVSEKNQERIAEVVSSEYREREHTPAAVNGADAPRHEENGIDIEAELARRQAYLESKVAELRGYEVELRMIRAAIAAAQEAKTYDPTAKKKRGRPKVHRPVGE